MKTSIQLCLIIVSTFMLSCSSVYNVIPVTANQKENKSQGLFYSLPKNKITITFDISKMRSIEGPYAQYASKYLGIKNVIKRSGSAYKIEEVTFNLTAEKDPDQTYFIKIPKCIKKKNQITIAYTNDGMLSSINTCNKKRKQAPTKPMHHQNEQTNTEAEQLLSISKNMEEGFDTIIERVALDSLTIEKKILKKIMIEKTPEQKAKDAADQIMHIRDERFKLLSGYSEVNYPEGTITYMEKGMEKMENEYIRMFTGLNYNTNEQQSFTFEPTKLYLDSLIPICRFSKDQGILDTSFYSGTPIFIKIESNNTLVNADSLLINRKTTVKKQGIYYRIPETVVVKLIHDDIVIASKELPIAQLGQITFLPPKKLTVRLDKKTGALDFIKIEK